MVKGCGCCCLTCEPVAEAFNLNRAAPLDTAEFSLFLRQKDFMAKLVATSAQSRLSSNRAFDPGTYFHFLACPARLADARAVKLPEAVQTGPCS